MLSCFSHVQLLAALWTCSTPGSSVHRILQVRILEWVAISFSKSQLSSSDETQALERGFIPLLILSGGKVNWTVRIGGFCSKEKEMATHSSILA